ncbi:DMT family transporter [Sphingobacterium faecale]|uniref:EamA family transporter n=1 Tax=Sphingobacterium faecale TaxID=2803775 RepID=A0ABS1R3H8_9SPHI|nr:EamA family transporter [Sphingobacterium faecale]MBL1408835.1 EamA family transporter [Sphingobacterium faecale]
MGTSHTFKGIVLAVTAATLWGVSGTYGQFLFEQRHINVEWLIAVRMLSAGVLFLLFSLLKKDNIWSIWRQKTDRLQLLIFSICGMLAVQYTYFAAVKHSNAATATVLQYLGPILIAVYLAFKYKRLPAPIEYLAIFLAVLGTFLLVTHGDPSTLAVSNTAMFLGIASALALAFYTLYPLQLLHRHHATLVIGWAMLLGGIVLSFFKAPWDIEGIWDSYTFSYIAFIIAFGTLIPFYAYLTAVKLIGAQKSSLLASAEPLSATIIAVLWLQVPFTTVDWIGSICIISTIFLLSMAKSSN